MKSRLWTLTALIAALSVSGEAIAGPATDALGTCLVQSSTGKDRLAFVRWFFVALAANPNVQSLTAATPEVREQASKDAAAVFQRLIFTDCRKEAVAAYKADGAEAVSSSFELFGRSAATELMSDPAVQKEMAAMGDHVDPTLWPALVAESKK